MTGPLTSVAGHSGKENGTTRANDQTERAEIVAKKTHSDSNAELIEQEDKSLSELLLTLKAQDAALDAALKAIIEAENAELQPLLDQIATDDRVMWESISHLNP